MLASGIFSVQGKIAVHVFSSSWVKLECVKRPGYCTLSQYIHTHALKSDGSSIRLICGNRIKTQKSAIFRRPQKSLISNISSYKFSAVGAFCNIFIKVHLGWLSPLMMKNSAIPYRGNDSNPWHVSNGWWRE